MLLVLAHCVLLQHFSFSTLFVKSTVLVCRILFIGCIFLLNPQVHRIVVWHLLLLIINAFSHNESDVLPSLSCILKEHSYVYM